MLCLAVADLGGGALIIDINIIYVNKHALFVHHRANLKKKTDEF